MKEWLALFLSLLIGCSTAQKDEERQGFVREQFSEASAMLRQRLVEESTAPEVYYVRTRAATRGGVH